MSFLLADRKVKIIATVGPNLSSYEDIKKSIKAGINIFRLNFSHSDHAFYEKVIKNIRKASDELRAPCGILQDLQGPKIRVGLVDGSQMNLADGEQVQMSYGFEKCEPGKIAVDLKQFANSLQVGAPVFIDDGLMELKVMSIEGDIVHLEVIHGGVLRDRKGVNLPGARLPIECLTQKDLDDLKFGLQQNVHYIALSFVRSEHDIILLKEKIKEYSGSADIRVISKIECLESLECLEAIVLESDAIMIARGDLAVEVGHARLPKVQKDIIDLCNQFHRPVITATQMLDSMAEYPQPTRAEVTDVAKAVMDGTDAVMLSRETSTGKYPSLCILTMHNIIEQAQQSDDDMYDYLDLENDCMENYKSVGAAACLMSLKLDVKLIVALSTSGFTAAYMSGFRPRCPIIAVTHSPRTVENLSLHWGLHALLVDPYEDSGQLSDHLENILLANNLVEKGDHIVLTLGLPVYQKGATNAVQVYKIRKDKSDLSEDLKSKASYRFLNGALYEK